MPFQFYLTKIYKKDQVLRREDHNLILSSQRRTLKRLVGSEPTPTAGFFYSVIVPNLYV